MVNPFSRKRNSNYNAGDGGYTDQYPSKSPFNLKLVPILGVLVIVFLICSLLFGSWYSLRENEYAVITTLGTPKTITDSGLHFKIPFIQKSI